MKEKISVYWKSNGSFDLGVRYRLIRIDKQLPNRSWNKRIGNVMGWLRREGKQPGNYIMCWARDFMVDHSSLIQFLKEEGKHKTVEDIWGPE